MIIAGKQIQNSIKVYGEQGKVSVKSRIDTNSSSQPKDEVILSSRAQEFGQILQSLKNMPEVRKEKVKILTERVESGDYYVEAKEIAGKIVGRLQSER